VIKLSFSVKRLPSVSEEEFHRYWRDEHGPLVRSVQNDIGLVRYVQSHTINTPINDVMRGSRNALPAFDGVAELWWDSMESFIEGSSSEAGRAAGALLLEDEKRFIDLENSSLFMVDETVIIDG
jgi:uncharacterized protein (TIGR02118 family)